MSKLRYNTHDLTNLEPSVVGVAVGDAPYDVVADEGVDVVVADDVAASCCTRGSCWGRSRSSSWMDSVAKRNFI